jgi:hypothetical protein
MEKIALIIVMLFVGIGSGMPASNCDESGSGRFGDDISCNLSISSDDVFSPYTDSLETTSLITSSFITTTTTTLPPTVASSTITSNIITSSTGSIIVPTESPTATAPMCTPSLNDLCFLLHVPYIYMWTIALGAVMLCCGGCVFCCCCCCINCRRRRRVQSYDIKHDRRELDVLRKPPSVKNLDDWFKTDKSLQSTTSFINKPVVNQDEEEQQLIGGNDQMQSSPTPAPNEEDTNETMNNNDTVKATEEHVESVIEPPSSPPPAAGSDNVNKRVSAISTADDVRSSMTFDLSDFSSSLSTFK